jgi:hypothetical protein
MSFNILDQGFVPGESYSRNLDRRVAKDEYPYGYDSMEPCAGYVNQGLIDEKYGNAHLMPQRLPWDYSSIPMTHSIPRTDKEMGSFPDSEATRFTKKIKKDVR